MPDVPLKYGGLNNRASQFKTPAGKVRNAVNVDFNADGSVSYPRQGYASLVSGTSVHALYDTGEELLFVDNGYLKVYSGGTTSSLVAVNNEEMSFTKVGSTVYYSNGTDFGKYEGGDVKNWGIEPPPINPKIEASIGGGMFAGTYRVAISWLSEIGHDRYEESAMTQISVVTLLENGGIRLSEFPAPPSYVQKVAVYVSGVNGADLYLYGEFQYVSGMAVNINKAYDALKARNMYCMRVFPKLGLTAHNGRIYWIDGPFVRYTQPHEYGIYHPNNYMWFEETVTNIVSLDRLMFVTTESAIYKIEGIDSEQTIAPILTPIRLYGVGRGLVCYDEFTDAAFMLTHKGFVAMNGEGEFQELAFGDVATPKFNSGTLALQYSNGSRRLVAIGKDGTVSNLQDSTLTTDEITRKGNAL